MKKMGGGRRRRRRPPRAGGGGDRARRRRAAASIDRPPGWAGSGWLLLLRRAAPRHRRFTSRRTQRRADGWRLMLSDRPAALAAAAPPVCRHHIYCLLCLPRRLGIARCCLLHFHASPLLTSLLRLESYSQTTPPAPPKETHDSSHNLVRGRRKKWMRRPETQSRTVEASARASVFPSNRAAPITSRLCT